MLRFLLTCLAALASTRQVSIGESAALQQVTTDEHVLNEIEPFLIHELSGKHFTYIVNPGNAGDSLIQYGSLLTLDALGFTYDLADPLQTFKNATLVYAGAGNLVGIYPDCRQFLLRNAPAELGNKIILLPATIKDEDAVLSSLESNVKIMTREHNSYEYVQKFVHPSQVYLAKDMAFQIPKYDEDVAKLRAVKPGKRVVGRMFRTDSEKTTVRLPQGNVDLSAKLPGVYLFGVDSSDHMLKDTLKRTAHNIFNRMTGYTEVWTNRLHMCIAASLMDREAHCFPNNYWKNQAIFEFSISENFPNSQFATDVPAMLLEADEEFQVPRIPSLRSGRGEAFVPPAVVLVQTRHQSTEAQPFSLLMVHVAPHAGPVAVTHHGAIAFIIAAILAVTVPRLVEHYVQNHITFYMVFLMDVAVWYLTTSVYIAASAQLFVADSSMTRRIVVTIVQVCAGAFLLPLGDVRKVIFGERKLMIVLVCAGCAYFFASLYVLEGITRASVVFVSNVRALEPLSTALFMVAFAGAVIRPVQVGGLMLAVGGVVLSSLDPSSAHSVTGAPAATKSQVVMNLMIVLLANVMHSSRNIIMAQSAKLAQGISKVTLFGCTCLCAVPFGLLSLAMTAPVAREIQPSVMTMRLDPGLLAISSTCFVLYNLCSFFVLVRVQPMVHAVLLTGKRVVTVVIACVLLKQLPHVIGAVGVCATVVGVSIYEADKRAAAKDPKPELVKQKTKVEQVLACETGLPAFVVSFAVIAMATLVHIRFLG